MLRILEKICIKGMNVDEETNVYISSFAKYINIFD